MSWKQWQWAVFLLLIAVDQVSKSWAAYSYRVVLNPGVSFGIFSQLPTFMLTLLLIILASAAAWWWRRTWPNADWASLFFWAGAVSNLFDRLLFGGVRDFLPVPFIAASKNNLADWFILVGLGVLLSRVATNSHTKETT